MELGLNVDSSVLKHPLYEISILDLTSRNLPRQMVSEPHIASQLQFLSAHITCLLPLANCESGGDYYCMYYNAIPKVVDIITPLAPESLKSCTVKNPKIKDIKNEVDNVEDVEDLSLIHI